ncbi:MAG: short-chain dehydrogenase, partial [Rhizorhabdus sp.]|nr:short-chain dehydrogenase [Rhizorhabdus sp.]
MEFGLQGKRAFVSGSTSGIGAATARMLASHGATVIVHGRDRNRADAVVSDIHEAGGRAIAVLGDLSDDGQVAALVEKVEE